jgi:hypothetical protein
MVQSVSACFFSDTGLDATSGLTAAGVGEAGVGEAGAGDAGVGVGAAGAGGFALGSGRGEDEEKNAKG